MEVSFASFKSVISAGAMLATLMCLSACAPQADKPLGTNDVHALLTHESCLPESQYLAGDPNYYGTAAGLNCILGTDSSIVLRVYDNNSATAQLIADWGDLVTPENQLAYSDNWFATGPPDAISALLAGFEMTGPGTTLPTSVPMTEEESNESLCSSIVYSVLIERRTQATGESPEQYYDAYPGLQTLVSSIEREISSTDAPDPDGDYFVELTTLTPFDEEIKAFCAEPSA